MFGGSKGATGIENVGAESHRLYRQEHKEQEMEVNRNSLAGANEVRMYRHAGMEAYLGEPRPLF